MILKYLEHEVQRLLAKEKFSLRQIAGLTGVSRGTVTNIANGTRQIKSQKYQNLLPLSPEDELASLLYSCSPKRCGGCGYIVYMPCRICAAREEAAAAGMKKELDPDPRDTAIILGLNLKTHHKTRYEEVRRWRREASQSAGVGQGVQAGQAIRRQRRENFVGSIDGSINRIDAAGSSIDP